ncbi:sialidase family protein [Niabella aurantiaca]|uniref:sialidase family protein n=1 Tax=Niabella aurantiaca TaxID=379900 RepID=UPI0003687A88|nr:sialidase family protein [Niabella aurantiaca]
MKSTLQYRNSAFTGCIARSGRYYMIALGAVLLTLFASLQTHAQKDVPVFVSGREGHKSYRIPAIIRLPTGKLLAFAEGRVHNAGDFGDINIVLKTSDDQGRSWSPVNVVVDAETLQAGNPAPVVDLTDPEYPAGRIFLFYNTGNNHEGEVRKGKGLREVWYKTSTDGGVTWSSAVNITMQTHRPHQPSANPAYNFSEDWRSYANTPGHAMQFVRGKYRGRIYVAANHSAGNPQPHFKDYRAHGFYTDDHGKTFHISENVDLEGGNENMAAEISKGRLMLNLRNQQGNVRARYTAISSNGGVTWYNEQFDRSLPDPVCQGSLLTIGKSWGRNILAFCNNADTVRRNHLTLRISKNDGKKWKKHIPVYALDQKGDVTAYSDIVKLGRRKIGVLYERNNYSEIIFTAVQW